MGRGNTYVMSDGWARLVMGVCPHCDWIGECGPCREQPRPMTSEQFFRHLGEKEGA